MKASDYCRSASGICATFSVLSGCGGLQPPIAAPGTPTRTIVNRVAPASSYRVLHRFGAGSDGAQPYAGLINVDGTLYGTTIGGGANDWGTVFSITTAGTEKLLYSFVGGRDGGDPRASLIAVNGTLYGTTFEGGGSGCFRRRGCGTVFSVTTTGKEKVLHSFAGGSDGANPEASLIDVKGTLYGTSFYGGTTGLGTVYSVSTTGTEKVLYNFGGGDDGTAPDAGLIDVNGTLYGTTVAGGVNDDGTVFSVTTGGTEKMLYSFGSRRLDGQNPSSSLIDVKGTLYGTTENGGKCGNPGCGTVFGVTTAGTEKPLYRFGGRNDGAYPGAALINVGGTLYGTTGFGGATDGGTIFSVTTTGLEKVLYRFAGGSDGDFPNSSLINVRGRLYGTTYYGGDSKCQHLGCGTVFALTP